MKTILVPTDFSGLSKVGVSYAIGLAKKMNARILLLSVINASSSSNTLRGWKKIEEEMIKTAQQDADQLIKEVKTEGEGVNISYCSVSGFPIEDMIDKFSVRNKVDLIVMGTKGATGLKKALMGSNATAVINNSSVPVVVVPEKARFRSIKKLIYATDVRNFQKEIRTVAGFAHFFDVPIQVLHVMGKGPSIKKVESDMAWISREKLIRMARYPKIKLHVLRNENIADAVNKFVSDEKADLLAMFTHRLDFYEKLLGKSVTRQLAFHSKVPMLIFNKTNY